MGAGQARDNSLITEIVISTISAVRDKTMKGSVKARRITGGKRPVRKVACCLMEMVNAKKLVQKLSVILCLRGFIVILVNVFSITITPAIHFYIIEHYTFYNDTGLLKLPCGLLQFTHGMKIRLNHQ